VALAWNSVQTYVYGQECVPVDAFLQGSDIPSCEAVGMDDFVDQIMCKQSGSVSSAYRFIHPALQHYLVARFLSQQAFVTYREQIGFWLQKDPFWKEVMLSLASCFHPVEMLLQVVVAIRVPLPYHRSLLAGACLLEVDQANISSEITQHILSDLRRFAHATHGQERHQAVLLLIAFRNLDIVALFITLLKDTRTSVSQCSAILWALGILGDTRATDIVFDIACGLFDEHRLASSSSTYMRCAALFALGNMSDPRTIPMLIDIVTNGHEHVHLKCAALWVLGQLEVADPLLSHVLVKQLDDQQPMFIRCAAAWAAGQWQDAQSVAYVFSLLQERDDDLQQTAQEALRDSGQRSLDVLLSNFHDPHVSSDIRTTILFVMGAAKLQSPQSSQMVLTALEDNDVDVREMAAWALGELQSFAAVNALVAQVENDDEVEKVRIAALEALDKIDHRVVLPLLLPLLRKQQGSISGNIGKTIESIFKGIGAPAVPSLLTVFQQSDSKLCQRAGDIVRMIGDRSVVDALFPLVQTNDTHPLIRSVVTEMVGYLGGQHTSSLLLAVLNDDQEEVRAAAVSGLMRLGNEHNPDVIKTLMRLVHSNNAHVCRVVARAVEYVSIATQSSLLLTILTDERIDLVIRQAAGRVLAKTEDVALLRAMRHLIRDPKTLPALQKALIDALYRSDHLYALAMVIEAEQEKYSSPTKQQRSEQLEDPWNLCASAFASPHEPVRRVAVHVLRNVDQPFVTELLLAALKDNAHMVRWEAVVGLKKRNDGRIRQRFLEMLDDRSIDVQLAVIDALGQAGDVQASVELLTFFEKSISGVACGQVAISLSMLQDPATVVEMLKVLWSAKKEVRSGAAIALSQLGFPLITNILHDIIVDLSSLL
jgi:HEAT repeat protein